MEINNRITKIIEYSGLSASEFADEIEVQRSNISHITSGRNKPSLEFITKIKNRFPEINWDWMILGIGEMVLKESSPLPENKSNQNEKEFSPDLFTLIDEDYKNEIFVQENIQNELQRESDKTSISPKKEKIDDSQQLEIQSEIKKTQSIVNEEVKSITAENKIKRIVFFYENGKFEAFEP